MGTTPSHGIGVLNSCIIKNFWYQTKTPLNEVRSSGITFDKINKLYYIYVFGTLQQKIYV